MILITINSERMVIVAVHLGVKTPSLPAPEVGKENPPAREGKRRRVIVCSEETILMAIFISTHTPMDECDLNVIF